MTTTEAQKTPMPATIKPCWDVRFEGGGTSGIRIFLDLDLIVMQNPWSILNAMSGELRDVEGSDALQSLFRITGRFYPPNGRGE
jgi:hypothetical protein